MIGRPLISQDIPESRVLIIITGGTICMQESDDGLVPVPGFLRNGLAPRPSFNDGSYPEPLQVVIDDQGTTKAVQSLRTPKSSYHRCVRYSVLEFKKLLDSSSINAAGWDEIARTVYRNYTLYDGFVVLHGTDSLAYTSSALSFMLQNLGKPVILTGSQAPIMQLQNDATDNLLSSLVIAGHFMIPEVCLYFNFKLFRGNRATKVSADDFNAFASPNLPPLATISSLRTNVQWPLIHRSTTMHPLSLQTNLDTTHVACLRVFPGIKPEMLDAVLRVDGLKGLILETFGAGNAPAGPDSSLTKILADAVSRGIVIVNVTQCLSGSVSPLYAPATVLGRAGVVFGLDMTTEAALTKLSYLLSIRDISAAEVARRMSISLRGELTEVGLTHFQHPGSRNGSASPEIDSLTAMGYKIAGGDHHGVKDILRFDERWLWNDKDPGGNTAVHLAATGPNVDILNDFLAQGASVHVRNRDGHTPLYLAAQSGSQANVDLLVKAGAHLHAEEIDGATAAAKAAGDEAKQLWKSAGLNV
ncbi:asparaginase-domain-containing protein [Myriangium duriaei CBS 260.36]|uniref:asparaginase n=1 Tax=Myriangium duriaei CBS 260.36 TaxID=1168546 RepID=A0A9P4IYU2_9PEZI|nr:asparaginase-domain-containing protein [Myriangium duriaei CBS 260.36]